jgi:hypothetical protein
MQKGKKEPKRTHIASREVFPSSHPSIHPTKKKRTTRNPRMKYHASPRSKEDTIDQSKPCEKGLFTHPIQKKIVKTPTPDPRSSNHVPTHEKHTTPGMEHFRKNSLETNLQPVICATCAEDPIYQQGTAHQLRICVMSGGGPERAGVTVPSSSSPDCCPRLNHSSPRSCRLGTGCLHSRSRRRL